jgi:hypothetical protein
VLECFGQGLAKSQSSGKQGVFLYLSVFFSFLCEIASLFSTAGWRTVKPATKIWQKFLKLSFAWQRSMLLHQWRTAQSAVWLPMIPRTDKGDN